VVLAFGGDELLQHATRVVPARVQDAAQPRGVEELDRGAVVARGMDAGGGHIQALCGALRVCSPRTHVTRRGMRCHGVQAQSGLWGTAGLVRVPPEGRTRCTALAQQQGALDEV
jgi:hypothetical protein